MHRRGSRLAAAVLITAGTLGLVGCGGQPAGSGTSAPPPSASAAPTPTPTPSASPAEQGCPPNDASVPSDADIASIEDVDGDGRPDEEFYTEEGVDGAGFQYGIRTASGAVITLKDDLAGPGVHSGWTSKRQSAIVTVLDDGRTATLHAFLDCGFVVTLNEQGQPYTFGLNGFSDAGTGVKCTDENGGPLLAGVLAARQADGTYTITGTIVHPLDGGTSARNESSFDIASGLPEGDPQVKLAMTSTCGDVPKVGTSGK
ncbi:hypothetical protein [Naasia aerilata]|uniref:Lipoprotein n=1 Tax=Naasia aerilata TaxID=1162966 RepID=A0ABM8GGK2_9MICO|nr:hypothetical protein [Naasia aerilata]BDZ47488.1 hypothetical protein GCM10025866_33970 [Naasia aerilata]